MKDAEVKFTELVDKFKDAVEGTVKMCINEIHSDMVPYLNEDTDHNATYQAINIVNKILKGHYHLSDGKIVVDGWSIAKLDDDIYNKLVDVLAEKCADEAMKQKVKRLENMLKEAYKI